MHTNDPSGHNQGCTCTVFLCSCTLYVSQVSVTSTLNVSLISMVNNSMCVIENVKYIHFCYLSLDFDHELMCFFVQIVALQKHETFHRTPWLYEVLNQYLYIPVMLKVLPSYMLYLHVTKDTHTIELIVNF